MATEFRLRANLGRVIYVFSAALAAVCAGPIAAQAKAGTLSWHCAMPGSDGSALMRGPVMIGIGTGAAQGQARATNPFIHVLNRGPVIAEVQSQSAERLNLSWTVDNAGIRPDLAFSRIRYAAQLNLRSGVLQLRATGDSFTGRLSATGRCTRRKG